MSTENFPSSVYGRSRNARIHLLPPGEKEGGKLGKCPISLLPSWEKVSAKLTDEGRLQRPHTFRLTPEIRASTAFAASSTFEPGPKISATPASRRNP
ncbi:hypothetical protein IMCC20628_03712 [Hoeflea sp. IMCC20628]|nr:hypothetical protein IMCC20628_03712 [Hoeflea sp. IMCC20628]